MDTDKQWHPQNLTNHLDGFEILRRGDKNVECRIVLHIDHFPQRFKVLEPLSSLVGMKEGTRAEVMASIWKLVKFTGSQDKDDGSILRPTGGLEKVSLSPRQERRLTSSSHPLDQILSHSTNYPRSLLDSWVIPTLSLSHTQYELIRITISIQSVLISQSKWRILKSLKCHKSSALSRGWREVRLYRWKRKLRNWLISQGSLSRRGISWNHSRMPISPLSG